MGTQKLNSKGLGILAALAIAGSTGACATVSPDEMDVGLASLRAEMQEEMANGDRAVASELNGRVATVERRIADLENELQQMEREFEVSIQRLQEELRFNVPVYFGFDDATVEAEDETILDRFGSVAQKYYPNALITVEGFTDASGNEAYNVGLGQRRAEAVAEYLSGNTPMTNEIRSISFGENTERLVIMSQVLDHEIELRFAQVGAVEADARVPAVYVLDGQSQFGTATDATRMLARTGEVVPHVIVAVGYPDSLALMARITRRMLDLTPTRDEAWESEQEAMGLTDVMTGGAASFMECLQREVLPMIEEGLPADPKRRVLYGHSLGGLFTLHTMFERPDAFSAYIAASPSLWWGDGYMLRREQEYANAYDDLATRLFTSVGGLESTPLPNATDERREEIERLGVVAKFEGFVDALPGRGYPSLQFESHVFDGETHVSVMPAALSRGLRAVLAPRAS